MPKRLIGFCLMVGFSLLLPQRAVPQRHSDDEYYPYAERERPRPRLESDTTCSVSIGRVNQKARISPSVGSLASICPPPARCGLHAGTHAALGHRHFVPLPHDAAPAWCRRTAQCGPPTCRGTSLRHRLHHAIRFSDLPSAPALPGLCHPDRPQLPLRGAPGGEPDLRTEVAPYGGGRPAHGARHARRGALHPRCNSWLPPFAPDRTPG